jgi:hypothetical protein
MIDVLTKDGRSKVVHRGDGKTLFETTDEAAALRRGAILAALAKRRGSKDSSEELFVLFPPTAPEPLIFAAEFALGAEATKREDVWDPVSKTWTMRNVEVFREGVALKQAASGECTEIHFTADDVIDLVEAFAVLEWQNPVKITHSRDQALVLDSLPTIARATALRAAEVKRKKDGRSVLAALADLEKVPPALYDAIREGKFPQRSIEFWRGLPRPGESGKKLPMVLKAISLLGDELPAVRGMPPLDTVPATFAAGAQSESLILSLENDPVTTPATDPKAGPGAATITLSAEEHAKQVQAHESLKAENARLKAAQDAQDARLARIELENRIASATRLAASFVAKGRITPAQEPTVLELLKALDDDKKDAVTLSVGEKTEKVSVRGAFLNLLDALPVLPGAPAAGAQTSGGGSDRPGTAGAFESLSIEVQSAKVAELGEKYLAEKKAPTQLAAYEMADKALRAGKGV